MLLATIRGTIERCKVYVQGDISTKLILDTISYYSKDMRYIYDHTQSGLSMGYSSFN